ncbi:MAG: flagellar biosynthesis protein FlgN [Thalassobium sp.]|nr:MAG: flagellar biosynthesis protein FlgN [Thalassobium sp.]
MDAERAAILEGAFDTLAAQAQHKEDLFDAVASEARPDQSHLRLLGARVSRNQELLQAAMAGVRDVQARMAALNAAHSTLNTYDRSGQPSQIARRQGKFEHKV